MAQLVRADFPYGVSDGVAMLQGTPQDRTAAKKPRRSPGAVGKAQFLDSVKRLRQKLQHREPFHERVRRGEAQFAHAHFEDIFSEDHLRFLGELACDARMQPAFSLFADCAHDAIDFLLLRILDAGTAASHVPIRRAAFEGELEDIQKVRTAVFSLRELSSAFICDTQKYPLMTLAKAHPDLLNCLERVEKFLLECERETRQALRGFSRKSRGAAASRTKFMIEMAHSFKYKLTKPHYEVVAALANILFETKDNDEVSAETVRAAYRKSGLFKGRRIAQ